MNTAKFIKSRFNPSVIGEQIAQILTEAILENVLKGGDQLIETSLQKEFGVSRSPLREAFRELEKKGLIVIIPRKGAFVKEITREDIEQNFPVRAALEGLAAKEAFKKITPEILEEMEHALEKMTKAVKKNDIKSYWKFHLDFHKTFINGSRNQVLIKILETLRMHSIWYQFTFKYYQEDLKKNLGIHKKIFSYFKNPDSDPQELANQVIDHIEIGIDRFLEYLEQEKALK